MMKDTRWIARLLKWFFAICMVGCILGAIVIAMVMVIDPKLASMAGDAKVSFNLLGQGGTLTLTNANAMADWMHGNVHLKVTNADGLFDVLKSHALPLGLLFTLFYAVLFDLLRRLFRNVVRGDSFTRSNVRLVQVIGLALVVFSFVSAGAEEWFRYALTDYMTHHATATLAGTPVPLSGSMFTFESDSGFVLNSLFLTGLLVLALSEVFRQGLMLKSESDLTI
jgi:hypothetical protein